MGFRVLRDPVPELPLAPDDRLEEPLFVDLDVLVLRDPGGEDVRVAMVATLGLRHTRPRHRSGACRPVTFCSSPRRPVTGDPRDDHDPAASGVVWGPSSSYSSSGGHAERADIIHSRGYHT